MHGNIAVIPARGGSKGIPRKNIIDFCGHPLVSWSIAAALRCPLLDGVYVSTDDEEIAAVATRYGASVIRRPAEISGDAASSESALVHACQYLQEGNGSTPEKILFLQATSPLRTTDELTRALQHFDANGLDSLFSAAQTADFCLWRGAPGSATFDSENFDYRDRKRRQDADPSHTVWIETGSFYITKTDLLIAGNNRLGGKIGVWPVETWKAFEIDDLEGLELCALLMRRYGLDQPTPVSER
jgi:CMP-N,N'-diacetyllegionaminic acid synthase